MRISLPVDDVGGVEVGCGVGTGVGFGAGLFCFGLGFICFFALALAASESSFEVRELGGCSATVPAPIAKIKKSPPIIST